MKSRVSVSVMIFAALLAVGTSVSAFAPASPRNEGKEEVKAETKVMAPALEAAQINLKVPLFSPLFAKLPVATVEDEPILLQELIDTLAVAHGQMGDEKAAGRQNFEKVLQRLINIRLILLEAANMGIDELPELKQAVDDYAEAHLRETLKQRQIKDVKPDDKVVEGLYREAVKEWKIRSLKFDKEEDAKAFAQEIEKGGDFSALADKLIESGKAEGAKTGEFLKPESLLPEIADAVAALKVGSVSPVIPIGPAFTILKLEDIRYPEGNAEAREAAYYQARVQKQQQVINKYNDSLIKKYVKTDKQLLKKLDFEAAKPGFEKLLKDKRAVARVKGEKPITVADLAEGIRQKFFHGIESAIKEKKVNAFIVPVMNEKLTKMIFTLEAKRLGIDKSEEFKKDISDYKDSILFGAFVQKVITPDVRLTEDEIKAYYNEHIAEYSSPAMARIQGVVFTKKNYAEDAIDKLKKGTDFQWVKNNAEGQVEKEKSESLLEFSGKLLVMKNFPDPLQKVIAGAKSGDIRFYQSPDGFFYALLVQDMFPPKASPLESERKEINKKIFGLKLNEAVEEWGEKLQKEYSVKIFITDIVK